VAIHNPARNSQSLEYLEGPFKSCYQALGEEYHAPVVYAENGGRVWQESTATFKAQSQTSEMIP